MRKMDERTEELRMYFRTVGLPEIDKQIVLEKKLKIITLQKAFNQNIRTIRELAEEKLELNLNKSQKVRQ